MPIGFIPSSGNAPRTSWETASQYPLSGLINDGMRRQGRLAVTATYFCAGCSTAGSASTGTGAGAFGPPNA